MASRQGCSQPGQLTGARDSCGRHVGRVKLVLQGAPSSPGPILTLGRLHFISLILACLGRPCLGCRDLNPAQEHKILSQSLQP